MFGSPILMFFWRQCSNRNRRKEKVDFIWFQIVSSKYNGIHVNFQLFTKSLKILLVISGCLPWSVRLIFTHILLQLIVPSSGNPSGYEYALPEQLNDVIAIRITPISWIGIINLRVEIIGCRKYTESNLKLKNEGVVHLNWQTFALMKKIQWPEMWYTFTVFIRRYGNTHLIVDPVSF